jgi:hypothetical protein
MELEQFATFEENFNPEIKEAQYHTEAGFSFDKENRIFCSMIIVNMMQEEKLLVKAELRSFFDIKPESIEKLRNKDGKIVFMPGLLTQFASLCYGAIRGVLFTKTMGTPLCAFVLPPLYLDSFIDKDFIV